jgi:hypothetical protein
MNASNEHSLAFQIKLERGQERDSRDVTQMVARHLMLPTKLVELFDRIVPQLIRRPSPGPASFV